MAKYNKKNLKRINELTEQGIKIIEICKAVGISQETYYHWKATRPEFSELLETAEERRWQNMRTTLQEPVNKLIQGFEVDYTESTAIQQGTNPDGSPKFVVKELKKVKKIFPPNASFVLEMLRALEPGRFRSDSTLNLNVKTISEMTQFSIKRRAQQTLPGAIINQQPNEDNYHEPEA